MYRLAIALLLPALAVAAPVPAGMKKAKLPDLNGTWATVRPNAGGKPDRFADHWVIDGSTLTVYVIAPTGKMVKRYSASLVWPDADAPNELDYVSTGVAPRTYKMWAEWDGDTLKLCKPWGENQPRPHGFEVSRSLDILEFRRLPAE